MTNDAYRRTPEGYFSDVQEHLRALDSRLARILPGRMLPGGYDIVSSYRGTTAERDAIYGVPATTAERVALANRQITWFNTDLGWTEVFYAVTGSAGLTAPGLMAGSTAAWYPVAGSMLSAWRVKNNGFQAVAAGTIVAPTLLALGSNIGGFVAAGNNGLTVPVAGYYEVKGTVYYSGHGAVSYLRAMLTSASTSGTAYITSAAPGAASADAAMHVTLNKRFVAGESIYVAAQASGASNVYGSGVADNFSTSIQCRYIGPPLA